MGRCAVAWAGVRWHGQVCGDTPKESVVMDWIWRADDHEPDILISADCSHPSDRCIRPPRWLALVTMRIILAWPWVGAMDDLVALQHCLVFCAPKLAEGVDVRAEHLAK
jgi:hypothetical protein